MNGLEGFSMRYVGYIGKLDSYIDFVLFEFEADDSAVFVQFLAENVFS